MGRGAFGKSLYLLFSVAVNITLLWKSTVCLKYIPILEEGMIGCAAGLDMEMREKKKAG